MEQHVQIVVVIFTLAIGSCFAEDKQPQYQVPNRQKFPHKFWNDPYIKLRPKGKQGGYPLDTCWSRGGICIKLPYCPTLEFEALLPGCDNRLLVCCKVWNYGSLKNYRDANVPPSLRDGRINHAYPTLTNEDSSLEVLDNDIVREMSLRNAYVVSKYLLDSLDSVELPKDSQVLHAMGRGLNAQKEDDKDEWAHID